MRVRRWTAVGALVVAAAVVSGAAFAVGPWPGLAQSVVDSKGAVRYTATRAHGSTTVSAVRAADGKVLASAALNGVYGIPAVTSNGLGGGLSPDGRLLVL